MKYFTLYPAIVFLCLLTCPLRASTYGGGTGEPNDPWQIWTPEQMNSIGVISADWNKCFILMADVNMVAYTGSQYNIIGNSTTKFTGTFDGNGHVISNLTIEVTGPIHEYAGMFGRASNATIRNLGLEDVFIECYCIYMGGLVGENSGGSIVSCYVTGSVAASGGLDWGGTAGGLVGKNSGGSITSCHMTGSVIGYFDVGGLVGDNYLGTLTSCDAAGSVLGTYYIGGLVGSNSGTLTACHAAASARGEGPCGGLVGASSGTLTACHATGSALSGMVGEAGGLVGYVDSGTLIYCYATGSACSGTGGKGGGLVGYNKSANLISCYATGPVSGFGPLGGLIGKNDSGSITSCYATGLLDTEFSLPNGGVVGQNGTGSIASCFWDIETTGTSTGVASGSSSGTTGLDTETMMTQSPFVSVDWDFLGETTNGMADIWRMCVDDVDYPRLTWQYVQDGDFACPDGVAMDDLARFANDWLLTYSTLLYGADADGDSSVTFLDFTVMAGNWMQGI